MPVVVIPTVFLDPAKNTPGETECRVEARTIDAIIQEFVPVPSAAVHAVQGHTRTAENQLVWIVSWTRWVRPSRFVRAPARRYGSHLSDQSHWLL